MKDYMVALMSRNHQLAEAGSIPLELFMDEPLLTMANDTFACDRLTTLLRGLGINTHHVFTGHHIEDFIEYVSMDMGTALVPEKLLEGRIPEDLVKLEIRPKIEIPLCVFYNKYRKMNEALLWFMHRVTEFSDEKGYVTGNYK